MEKVVHVNGGSFRKVFKHFNDFLSMTNENVAHVVPEILDLYLILLYFIVLDLFVISASTNTLLSFFF